MSYLLSYIVGCMIANAALNLYTFSRQPMYYPDGSIATLETDPVRKLLLKGSLSMSILFTILAFSMQEYYSTNWQIVAASATIMVAMNVKIAIEKELLTLVANQLLGEKVEELFVYLTAWVAPLLGMLYASII